MVELVLKYEGKEETFQVASTWEELTHKQLLYIAEFWESWAILLNNKEDLLKAKALLFVELLMGNTVFNRKKRIDLIAQLSNETLYQLTQMTNFVFKSNALIKCPMKSIRGTFRKLYAPNDGLGNITAMEFTFADDFFLKYADNGTVENLDLMIACLYRYRQWLSNSRVVFDKARIGKSLPAVQKLSYAEKQLILIWYRACRKKIIDANKELFSEKNQSDAKWIGWLPIILAMSGDKFGTFEQTGNTDLHLIFMELKYLSERAKPREK